MFQAWLVKMAKIAASSAPKACPGARAMNAVTVTEMKPRTGTDCRISSIGTRIVSARRLLAARLAKVKVKMSDATIAASIRMVERKASSGSAQGESEIG